MILTEIEKIDSLVEEVLGYESCFIRVDRNDYEAVKRGSATLKAVSIRGRGVDKPLLAKLDAELEQAGRADVGRIFLSIGCSSVDDVSYDDAMSVLKVIEKGSEHPNLVWGIGEDATCNANEVRIILVLGYDK